MPNAKTKVLIVDDDVSLRTSLSKLFDELGYSVRSAADGFAALSEILRDTPDVLLSEVHQRFPSIGLVAMSGAFEGNVVPPGVIAAAFYAKGSDLTYLLRIVKAMDRAPCTSFQ